MSQPPSVTPLSILREPTVLVWVVLAGIGLAAVLALGPTSSSDRLVQFGLATLFIQWVTLGTLALLYALERPLSRMHWTRIFVIGLGLLLLLTAVVHSGSTWVLFRAQDQVPREWPGSSGRAVTIAFIVYLLGAGALLNHARARRLALSAKQAELEALQARTHPHFLFNSLNTALALLHQRPDDAERVLLDLSDLFRSALTGPRFILLAAELDLARRYVEIEQLRLGDRLEVSWELPSPMPLLKIPALSVQPLLENAVRHGIERRRGGGRVDVLVTANEDFLQITVRNDMPSENRVSTQQGHGVGQPSVASRIEAMTGGRGTLVTAVEKERYRATITIPANTHSAGA